MLPKVVVFKEPSAIPVSAKAQIIARYHDCFPPHIFEGKHADDWFEDDTDKPVRFVMLEDVTVVSHAAVITRTIEVCGIPFNLAGLGGVFTGMGHRKKGFGSQVIRAAMEYINSNDYDIAVLFCLPKNQLLYENLNWRVFHNPSILVGKNRETAKPLPKEEVCMIRYLSPKSKLHKSLFEKTPIFFGEEW